MSALTDRIAAEHAQETVNGRYGCACGESSPDRYFDIYEDLTHWHRAHVAEVAEAAVRERVARDIEYAESMSRASLIERPKIGPGEFLNDWQWAARIARWGAA